MEPQGEREAVESQPTMSVNLVYYGWVIVAVCFVVIALIAPLQSSFSIFYVAVVDEFNWSRSSTSGILALHLVLNGLMGPFAGGFIDRYGPKHVMPVGAVVTAIALFILSRATEQWHFYVAFGVIAAVGSTMIHIVPLTTLVSHWFVRHRGTAIGLVAAGSGAGQLALMPLLQYMIETIGWRNAYLALGAALLVIPTVLIRLFLFSYPEERGMSASDEMTPRRKRETVEIVVGSEGREIERKRGVIRRNEIIILDREWAERDWTLSKAVVTFRFWAITLMMAMFAAGFYIISVHLVAYLRDKSYSVLLAGSIVGLQGMFNFIGKGLGGALCDRIGREKTLTLSIAAFIICILLLSLGGVIISPALIYVFCVFYGVGYGMAVPALITSSSDLFGGRHFGAILGVILLGGFFGGAAGTWLGGKLFDVTQGYTANFVVGIVTMVISLALIWSARPSRVRLIRSVVESA
ncbi:MAG: MFS transporter [Acidobacteria bacterium]|nr:MFS transporter [Acidobacteriota bacterium]MCW5970046.1 MFS transporter [Blastocatellales bacterium]